MSLYRYNLSKDGYLDCVKSVPVGEDRHTVSTASKLVLCIRAGAPLRLTVERGHLVEASLRGILLPVVESIAEFLDLNLGKSADVTTHVLLLFLVHVH